MQGDNILARVCSFNSYQEARAHFYDMYKNETVHDSGCPICYEGERCNKKFKSPKGFFCHVSAVHRVF